MSVIFFLIIIPSQICVFFFFFYVICLKRSEAHPKSCICALHARKKPLGGFVSSDLRGARVFTDHSGDQSSPFTCASQLCLQTANKCRGKAAVARKTP
uniref:Putative secreted protein n=1 Tax=Ixodes ricinus TaxID=34613 RepID=A0A6B0UI43_IXORI